MLLKIFLFFNIFELVFGAENKTLYYDSYHGIQISDEEYRQHVVKNTTFWCANAFKSCDPHEWRRIDGSCVNLKHPNRGMPHTPTLRLLPPVFSGNGTTGYEPRTARCGGPLPPERPLRTSLLPEVREPHEVFTQLLPHYALFHTTDVLSIHDTVNYVFWKPYCCLPQGQKDRECIPVKIPDDDPVHRFSNFRCMKLTRPFTFQSQRCIKNTTLPARVISSTPTLDVAKVYGHDYDDLNKRGRLFKDGLMQYEMEDGRMWPPSFKGDSVCYANEKPRETRCHNTPELITNSLIGINLFAIWFWRLHNYIAMKLAKMNPCWDDDRLFYTARDINIGLNAQIVTYEMLPTLMGRDNLLREGVISSSPGFRDLYDENVIPQITAEYTIALRWFHVAQANDQKMIDANGHYLKSIPLTNLTMRTGYLAVDNNMDYITQGAFRQAGGSFKGVVDPDIAEIGIGPFTDVSDLATYDLVKNRHMGLAPYVKYLELCTGRPFRTFDDLEGFIRPEKLDILKEKYKDIEDIDLLVGMWVELPAEGSYLPRTVHCIMMDQHIRFMVMDRHWYERPNRPHAFTREQLHEIRKMTMSRLLCNIGDSVTAIQPNSFIRDGPGNEITSCENIPDIDFRPWIDPTCRLRYE